VNETHEDLRFFVLSQGILGLRTNLDHFAWSFGLCAPPATRQEYDSCALRLSMRVGKLDAMNSQDWGETGGLGKYHYFSGIAGKDHLRYRRSFILGTHLELEAGGLLSGEPEIRANRNYQRFVTGRFMNLHSPAYILTDIAVLLLLRLGYATLHCSAFRMGNATVVVFAAPNTGKTLSSMMACLQHGAEFLAEDLAITDGRKIYAVPWTSTFRYYSQLKQPFSARVAGWGRKLFPPLELIATGGQKRISAYLDSGRICPEAEITHIVLLGRGKLEVCREERCEVLRKIINLNRFEFNYIRSPLITAYEFYNPALDVLGNFQRERQLLERLVESSRDCITVRVNEPTEYISRILDALA
jgi:hypothetical protein